MILEEEDVSFVHNKDEAWTVGYVAEQRKDRIAVRAAASFCNYKDKFNRKIGRQIVTGRLNCDRDNGRLHHVEFFLSGKMPTTGDMWRQFERAVVSQTMEAYQEGVGLEEQMGATRKDGECIAPVAGPDFMCWNDESALRAAVAEYDPKLDWFAKGDAICHRRNGDGWLVTSSDVLLAIGDLSIHSPVITSHAVTRRRMDKAAKAFMEACV